MAILRVDNVGAAGFLPDLEYWQLEKNAWTLIQDASLSENSLRPPYLTSPRFTESPFSLDRIHNSIFIHNSAGVYWYVMCTSRRVYVSRGEAIFDITPDGLEFSGTLDDRWQATFFNGFLILNNARNEPYYWPIETAPGEEVAKLEPLSSYPGSSPWPAGQTCEFIVGFSNALFAGNIRNTSNRFPYLVLFSDFAEPGTLPQAWEPRPENSAGSRDLAEGQDEIVAGSVYKDNLIVRKRNSAVTFRYSGGQFVYQRKVITAEVACINKHAIGNSDLFQISVSDNDIFITTGQSHQSVVKNRTKEWFFKNLNKAELSKIFVVHSSFTNEVWICAPHGTSEFCNVALIWNYSENTFTTRTCPNYLSGVEGYGIAPDGFESWDDLTTSWEDLEFFWGLDNEEANQRRLFFAQALPINEDDWTRQIRVGTKEGVAEVDEVLLERMHIPFPRGDVMDWESRKQISYIAPKCRKASRDFYIDIWLGLQEDLDSPIKWVGPKRWRMGKKGVFFDKSARFVSIRARLPADEEFRLTGYDVEYKLVSKR